MENKVTLLSHPLSEATPGYGGGQGFERRFIRKMTLGDSSNNQEWSLSNHIGTHVDCPFHFDMKGQKIHDYTPSEWVFDRPYLLDSEQAPGNIIEVDERWDEIPTAADLLLVRTGFEKFRREEVYWKRNPGFSPEMAKWLRAERPNIKAIGFDFISLTSYENRPLGREAHRAFLSPEFSGEPVRIVEDMKLSQLSSHPRQVIISPLFVEGADGSPVTVWALA